MMPAKLLYFLKSYPVLVVTSFVLEYFWVKFPARNLYREVLQTLPYRLPLVMLPLLIFLIYTIVLYFFCALPSMASANLRRGLVAGAICGGGFTVLVHVIAYMFLPAASPLFVATDILWRSLAGAMSCGMLYYIEGPEAHS